MPKVENEPTLKEIKKSLHIKNGRRRLHTKRTISKLKSKTHQNDAGSTFSKKKVVKYVRKGLKNDGPRRSIAGKQNVHKTKSSRKKGSLSCKSEHSLNSNSKKKQKHANQVIKTKKFKKRKRQKRTEDNVEPDEASRLQRRTRYLLIKIKREQDLIDAYSGEGWKGQSREKIKPEKELQRAQKQILKCKLGIREAIHQIDLLCSLGCIDDSAITQGESVHHEHIFCSKCKSQEAFHDNDIIPCGGTCSCAFHQKCIDPPLFNENKEESWFCKFCSCKREILEAMNAHLGTNFSVNSYWQDVFTEEATLPDGGDHFLHPEEEWPSDDSEDDDYDPYKLENNCSCGRADSEDDIYEDESSSSSLWSLEVEVFSESERLEMISKGCQNTSYQLNVGVDSDETTNCETISGRRQRKAIDYIKLDEMLEKGTLDVEQISDDEDWVPTKRRRKEKESDAASTLMTLSENEKSLPDSNKKAVEETLSTRLTKRPLFRIPAHAVERLRLVFSENELPSKAVKEDLSKQLGLASGKVNKWFKNARYLALKARKEHRENSSHANGSKVLKEFKTLIGREKTADPMRSKDVTSPKIVKKLKNLKKFCTRKKPYPLASCSRKKLHKGALLHSQSSGKAVVELGDDVSLKLLREKAKRKKRKVEFKPTGGVQEAEVQMERLCKMKSKLECLQQVLLQFSTHKSNITVKHRSNESSVMCIPIAEIIEKRALA